MKRQNGSYDHRENVVIVEEAFILDLLDFCGEHMNSAYIYYRLGKQEWQELHTISSVLEANWIDQLIVEKRITPYFQPIVDGEQTLFAHEVLSRSFREDGSLIPSGELFTSAKKRNRLFALDKLCRLTAVAHSPVLRNQKVFINFLPTSIYSPEHCLQTTLELAHRMQANPATFVFEVVESEKVDDLEHLKTILRFYRQHGFEYALDDVGAGYSTIELLRELQPTYMKLDMKYVRGISDNPQHQEMAATMLEAAQEIGSIPLAEGIEEERDFLFLKRLGFQLFQGFLFGKPAPSPIGRTTPLTEKQI
ncbi:EAL domain-containing protein [Brevibacillus fluminis]|uniref:EAL domain-containing protein n=2 Tax=Brevibacillus fluminis TaxID=511487 RepID=A0A3M8DAY4_9BACL|nr:EAL domain-containing protein [Brevibacillus fluminis]